jgi:uncharacterized membrane protein
MSEYAKFWGAVGIVVLYLLAQFGVDLPENVSDAVTTIIVVLGPAVVWRLPNTQGVEAE